MTRLNESTFGFNHIGKQRAGSLPRFRPHAPRTIDAAAEKFGDGAEIATLTRDGTSEIYVVPADDRDDFERWAHMFCLRDSDDEPDGDIAWHSLDEWLPAATETDAEE